MSNKNMTASDLIKRNQARTLYANFLIQNTQLNAGCTNRIDLTSGNDGSNPASDLTLVHRGEALTPLEEQSTIIGLNVCADSVAPDIVRPGLQLYYNAGTTGSYPGSGTTVYDLSNKGYNGTLTNGTTFSNTKGGAFVFDGTNDYINTGQSIDSEDFTLMAWINVSDITNYRMIFSKEVAAGAPWNYRLFLEITTGGLVLDVANPSGNSIYYSSVNLADGTWHFVCGSRNSTTQELKLYIDGALVLTQADNLVGSITNSQPVWIGLSAFLGGRYPFKGSIGSTLIYNRALTDAEVLQDYNATKARFA